MNKNRLVFLLYSIIFFFFLICFRVYYLQVWKHEFFKTYAFRQYMRVQNVSSLRGNIVDRKGRVLVFSSYADSCYADPQMISRPRDVARRIAAPLGIDADMVCRKIKSPKRRFVWLKRRMDGQAAEKIKRMHIEGIGFVQEDKRMYPFGKLAGHLIGKLGTESQALSGIEFATNEVLSGGMRTTKTSRDALGKDISLGYSKITKENGNVRITIDRTIQYIAETELEKTIKQTDAEKGIVVVQEPFSGEILAMAEYPPLDMEETAAAKFLFNNAISGMWEPGSTMKVFTVAGALEEGIVKCTDMFDCENGVYKVLDRVIHDHEKHGVLSVQQIIEYSSNIGMAKIGTKLGKSKLYCYLRAFGFGAYTGIQLAGEARGMFRPPRYWSGVSLSMLSFGQEIGVTPIQMIGAYSAIANGGYLMQPRIIKDIIDSEGTVIWTSRNVQVRRVISSGTVAMVKAMMHAAVESGTGVGARVDGFRVCGKTGTAQQIDKVTKQYSSDRYLASFCGFLPFKNPRVCILVYIDNPKGYYWGGLVAAPVFSRIASRTMAYLNVPPDSDDPDDIPEKSIKRYAQASQLN